MMTQKERVRNALHRAPDGVCARWFVYEMSPGIPRVAARISELRDEHMDIRTERCDLQHHEHQAAHIKYRLDTGRLFR